MFATFASICQTDGHARTPLILLMLALTSLGTIVQKRNNSPGTICLGTFYIGTICPNSVKSSVSRDSRGIPITDDRLDRGSIAMDG